MKKKVLFVVDERMMGGVSILLSDILNRINIKKYHIDVLVLHNHGDYLNDLPSDVNIIYGTKFFNMVDYNIKEALKTFNPIKIFSKLRLVYLMKRKKIGQRIIKERKKILDKKYDVEVAFKDGFCALFTAYGDSKKKYHWLHSDYAMYDCTANYYPLFKNIFPKFDKIIGISNGVLERFKNKYDVQNTEVIMNIIDKEKLVRMGNEEKVSFPKNKINLVSVGRIHNMKGYDRLVDVLAELDKNGYLENVITRIIGDGPDFELVKKKVNDYDLAKKVLLMGRKRNPYPYVKESDCFLMCSRYEPFGLVILEAMILGTPVLSLDVASIKEIMSEEYGMIYENSRDGLYEGILNIINNPSILNKYKKALKKYDYSINKILKQIEELLDE